MNTKRIIRFIAILSFIALSLFWIMRSVSNLKQKEKALHNKKELSRIMGSLSKASSHATELNYEKPTLVLYFNSECEYCQEEFAELESNISGTEDLQICAVSYQTINEIESFAMKYRLLGRPNFFLFQIRPDQVVSTFGKTNVPQIFVYKNNSLVNEYKSKTELKAILRALNDEL